MPMAATADGGCGLGEGAEPRRWQPRQMAGVGWEMGSSHAVVTNARAEYQLLRTSFLTTQSSGKTDKTTGSAL